MSNVGFGAAIGGEQVLQAQEVGFKSIINICLDHQIEQDMLEREKLEHEMRMDEYRVRKNNLKKEIQNEQ